MVAAGPVEMKLPRAPVLLLSGAAAVIVIGGMRELQWLIGPVFLALVIVILVHPLHQRLHRAGMPAAFALVLMLLVIYAVIVVLAAVIVYSLSQLATLLPGYTVEARAVVDRIGSWLGRLGVGREQVRSLTTGLDLSRFAGPLTTLLGSIVSFGANLVFLLSLLLFLGVESAGIAGRAEPLMRTRPRAGAAMLQFVSATRRFLAMTTFFAVVVGVVDTVLLIWIGIPLAGLWGLLAAVCNYIPYAGFVIGLVPPALLALLGGDWHLMLLVIVIYIVVNSLLTTLAPAYFVGDVVGLSMTVTLVSVVFWTWVIGPLGAVLAIPLTLLAKAVLIDSDPRASWAQGLVGSKRATRPARSARRLRPKAGAEQE